MLRCQWTMHRHFDKITTESVILEDGNLLSVEMVPDAIEDDLQSNLEAVLRVVLLKTAIGIYTHGIALRYLGLYQDPTLGECIEYSRVGVFKSLKKSNALWEDAAILKDILII